MNFVINFEKRDKLNKGKTGDVFFRFFKSKAIHYCLFLVTFKRLQTSVPHAAIFYVIGFHYLDDFLSVPRVVLFAELLFSRLSKINVTVLY